MSYQSFDQSSVQSMNRLTGPAPEHRTPKKPPIQPSLPLPRHVDCARCCQQAEDYGVSGEARCTPACVYLLSVTHTKD